jgi:lipopolysaccharide biosynthesis glycosyltransferase
MQPELPLRIFVGWDSREDIAYQVCKRSIENHTSIPVDIRPIKQFELRGQGVYTRQRDQLSSTEFSFTRFLTPYLAGYTGWAVFVDCDFLFRGDIAGLLDYADGAKACFVVKHDYWPLETVKMDNQPQHRYTRKNWSSFMFINCAHPQVKILTPNVVNAQTGMYLHRFEWLEDGVMGSLPSAWNYLEGWHTKDDCPNPLAVHFTRGGPWFADYKNVEYANEWNRVAASI